jgi:hypothetical protein
LNESNQLRRIGFVKLISIAAFVHLLAGYLSSSELSRFSVGGLNLGESIATLNQGKDELIKELQRRTQVDPDLQKGWVWVNQDLKNAPPFLWIVLKTSSLYDKELPQRLQRFMAMGGTIFVENASFSQKELTELREKVFPKKEARSVDKDELLTRTFYILPPDISTKFKTLRQAGRVVWVESPGPLLSKLSGSSREREMAVRSSINLVLYSLTGSYKDDLTHMRYLMRRRKK